MAGAYRQPPSQGDPRRQARAGERGRFLVGKVAGSDHDRLLAHDLPLNQPSVDLTAVTSGTSFTYRPKKELAASSSASGGRSS